MKSNLNAPSAALLALVAAVSSACSGSTDKGKDSNTAGFNPPPAPAGFTRLTSPLIENIGPGDDITYCQYVMAPTDHDVDILSVGGYQSKFGHHVVAFA